MGVTDEQTALLRQNKDISWIGEYSAIGFFYVDDKTITVAYGDEDYFSHQEEKTLQGSVPQKENEIMLPQNYIDFLGKAYKAGDVISLDVTGTGQKAEYTLSGILDDTKESNGYFIYVSKELARDLAKDSFQVTAYTRLNTDAISSTAILDFASKAIQNTGIVEEQVMLTEYIAVMSGVITSGIPIPVPLLAALTAILAATIVYGVFYTKIVKNVQMFGQLRTLGMTKRQIKRMAGKEGRLYALTGIPLGLVTGVLIGFIGCPDGFRLKTTVIYAVLIAAVAFMTVNIAIFKPVRVCNFMRPCGFMPPGRFCVLMGLLRVMLARSPTPVSLSAALRFGRSSTNNRNGGQYGYYQFAGLLPILYIRLLHGSIGRSCRNVQRV